MKSQSYPETIPEQFAKSESLTDAYRRGWNHGHGFACHNVPEIGKTYWTDADGKIKCDAENIRDVHTSLCFAAESNSRDFSPFEFTAHEFNSAECDDNGEWDPELEGTSEELWEAFDTGISDAICADLATYTDADYRISEMERLAISEV